MNLIFKFLYILQNEHSMSKLEDDMNEMSGKTPLKKKNSMVKI